MVPRSCSLFSIPGFGHMFTSAALAASMLTSAPAFGGGDPDPAPGMPECPLWDNGNFAPPDGQMSQVLTPELDPIPTLDMRVADDIYLEPGYMHRLNRVRATFYSTVTIEDALLEIREDCNGTPGNVILTSEDAIITPAGGAAPVGQRFNIAFESIDIWVRGGVYWVTVAVLAESPANPADAPQFFWGQTDVQKGNVPKFRSPTNGHPNWTPIDSLNGTPTPSRCKDFAFRVGGRSCKILHDNGTWNVTRAGALGAPSIINSAFTASNVRSADQFVTNPCRDEQLCYVEAYLLTNCPRAQIELYEQSCQSPGTLVATLTPTRTTDVGDVTINNKNLDVLRVEAWLGLGQITLLKNRTYWISAIGIGDNSLNGSVSYFARNFKCERPDCLVSYTPGQIKGPGVSRVNWTPVQQVAGAEMDFAFTVAVRDDGPIPGNLSHLAAGACSIADHNASGQVEVVDLFAFLDEYFTGCP